MNTPVTTSTSASTTASVTASILAVGTELTTGQITNRNASWISQKLTELGIEVLLHETVADDRPQIHRAIAHCAQTSALVFITGGLGPTSDDFTREVVAEWLGLPLQFDENSWKAIQKRLGDLKISVAESNRQQCYFPSGAKILPNPAGTAAGFTISPKKESGTPAPTLWILPGPPAEIAAIWNTGIQGALQELYPQRNVMKLYTWECMGKSEAELGEITERVLHGSDLKIGYRAHRPYIEIKVWVPEQEIQAKTPWIEKLDHALSPWTFTRQDEDLVQKLLYGLQRSESVEIFDSASGGFLTQRLGDTLRQPSSVMQAETLTMNTEWAPVATPEEWVNEILSQADDATLTLALSGFTPDGRGAIGLRDGNRIFQLKVETPYKTPELLERMRGYLVEVALKQWSQWLDSGVS